jgi:hypothetical protein
MALASDHPSRLFDLVCLLALSRASANYRSDFFLDDVSICNKVLFSDLEPPLLKGSCRFLTLFRQAEAWCGGSFGAPARRAPDQVSNALVSELWRTSLALTQAQKRVRRAHELLRSALDETKEKDLDSRRHASKDEHFK